MVDSKGVKTVVRCTESGKFLLMRRSSDKDEYPGFWEFPGGGLEENEEPREGALRELREETGLRGEIVDSGSFEWHSDHTGRDILSYSFLVEVEKEEIELSREHSEHEWLEIEEIFEKEHFPLIEKDLEYAGVEHDEI
jgi:8-oxo-dGTP diphosphatase